MQNWRIRSRDREEAGDPYETANDRFQRRYRYLTAVSLLIATSLHFGVFALNPRMVVRAMESTGEETVVLTLPPEVRIPPPPQSIARPATPRVSAGPVADELTISPTTFDANPAANLPPPPADVKRQKKGGPSYVEHDVAPRILNGAEVAKLLEDNYPRTLREAGVQGTVILWVYVDSEGRPGETAWYTRPAATRCWTEPRKKWLRTCGSRRRNSWTNRWPCGSRSRLNSRCRLSDG